MGANVPFGMIAAFSLLGCRAATLSTDPERSRANSESAFERLRPLIWRSSTSADRSSSRRPAEDSRYRFEAVILSSEFLPCPSQSGGHGSSSQNSPITLSSVGSRGRERSLGRRQRSGTTDQACSNGRRRSRRSVRLSEPSSSQVIRCDPDWLRPLSSMKAMFRSGSVRLRRDDAAVSARRRERFRVNLTKAAGL
jgi:hypothetical protein